jgi:hypothetical protein
VCQASAWNGLAKRDFLTVVFCRPGELKVNEPRDDRRRRAEELLEKFAALTAAGETEQAGVTWDAYQSLMKNILDEMERSLPSPEPRFDLQGRPVERRRPRTVPSGGDPSEE